MQTQKHYKGIILFLIFSLASLIVNAQYSVKKFNEKFRYNLNFNVKGESSFQPFNKQSELKKIELLLKIFSDSSRKVAIQKLLLKKLDFYGNDKSDTSNVDSLEVIDKLILETNFYYKRNRQDLKLIGKYYNEGHAKFWFPALNNREALKFYENDSSHTKLFRNNSVNYSPTNNQMILATEAINDYFGPFRLGFGFQIKSEGKVDSLSTTDSTINSEKQTDLVSNLKNQGGDVNLTVSFPLLQIGSGSPFFSVKSSLFSNLGFSVPKFNETANDYTFNNYGGVNAILYSNGLLGKISLLVNGSVGYVNGNKNFQKTIKNANQNDPTAFWLNKLSIGLDFNDSYRLQADFYSGHSFVRENFPATITFTIRPDK